jgi:hypothetical protein
VPTPNYRHRYRTEPEFRAQEILRTKLNHIKNSSSPAYMELTRQRKMRSTYKDSIWIHQQAIQRLKKMIKAKDRIVEELELVWGKERADRKRLAQGIERVEQAAQGGDSH